MRKFVLKMWLVLSLYLYNYLITSLMIVIRALKVRNRLSYKILIKIDKSKRATEHCNGSQPIIIMMLSKRTTRMSAATHAVTPGTRVRLIKMLLRSLRAVDTVETVISVVRVKRTTFYVFYTLLTYFYTLFTYLFLINFFNAFY